MTRAFSLTVALAAIASTPALAHAPGGDHASFAAGFLHPLGGFDHLLAMAAFGLWAAMGGGRAGWLVPSAFLVAMGSGYAAALGGLNVAFVEPAILASVLVSGALVAGAIKLPVVAGSAVAGGFGIFHGHAHGAEIGGANALSFGAGFGAATILLLLTGFAIGTLAGEERLFGVPLARALGGLTVVAGLSLAAGLA